MVHGLPEHAWFLPNDLMIFPKMIHDLTVFGAIVPIDSVVIFSSSSISSFIFRENRYCMSWCIPFFCSLSCCLLEDDSLSSRCSRRCLKGNSGSTACTPIPVPLQFENFSTVPNGSGLVESDRDTSETKNLATRSKEIPLCQRLIAALVSEEENLELCYSGSEDLEFDLYDSEIDIDTLESNPLNHMSLGSLQLGGRSGLNCYSLTANDRPFNELDHTLLDTDVMAIPGKGLISNFKYLQNGLHSDEETAPDIITCSAIHYGNMSLDERIILEMQSVELYLERVPDLTQTADEEISDDINRLEDIYSEQVTKKKSLIGKLLNSALERREVEKKEFEHHALDKLVAMCYEKYRTCRGSNAYGGKSVSSKMAKQAALVFVKRTLERCQKFKATGKSCFSEPLFMDMFLSCASRHNDAQGVVDQYANSSDCSLEVRVSAPTGSQQISSFKHHGMYFSNALLSDNYSYEQTNGTLSNGVKKTELLLGGTIATSGIETFLPSSAKGNTSDRDREGKGNNREALSRNIKGERKSKTKPKQKTSQLSSSVNVKLQEQHKSALDEQEVMYLSHFDLPGRDVLGVPDDQGQDIGSWLNIDDDGLHDLDNLNGLEIPMDDLADLNMMA